MNKTSVKIAGVSVAGNTGVGWRFQTGVAPYVGTFSVHVDQWKKIYRKRGDEVVLEIIDSRGVRTRIEKITILHEVPSDSPHRRSFIVADRRWKWDRNLVVRSYNIPKRTGDTAPLYSVPYPGTVTVDEYQYKGYSLKDGKRWTAKDVIKDILDSELDGDYLIESFPIEGDGEEGQFSIQNLVISDSFDVALSRALKYVPGAEVYIRQDGKVVIFDGTDLQAAKEYHDSLPEATWDGDKSRMIDRSKLRPKEFNIYYQREFELLTEYEDNYQSQLPAWPENSPYMDNVLPATDPTMEIQQFYDPGGTTVEVSAGTWLEASIWLDAMDQNKVDGSVPWDFDSLKWGWMTDQLDSLLGTGDKDNDPNGNVPGRVAALKQHFRQTFRINDDYTDRIQSIIPFRAKVLDPVTKARIPAQAWCPACFVASEKGLIVRRGPYTETGQLRNLLLLDRAMPNSDLLDVAPTPATVSVINEDAGILSIRFTPSPYGMDKSIIPSNLVESANMTGSAGPSNYGGDYVCSRSLGEQDQDALGAGFVVSGYVNGLVLYFRHFAKIVTSVVSGAPNNKSRMHKITVKAEDIKDVFRTELGIKGGDGPPMDIFISPDEVTARFAIADPEAAVESAKILLGLEEPDEEFDADAIPGYTLTNRRTELEGHSRSVAAEAYVAYADSIQGRVSTVVPKSGIKLKGNMSGASIAIGAYPSAKESATFEFPGQQRPISRFSLMPSTTRNYVLGIIRLPSTDK